jgi:hypothetical protein
VACRMGLIPNVARGGVGSGGRPPRIRPNPPSGWRLVKSNEAVPGWSANMAAYGAALDGEVILCRHAELG